jgi:hypothetical protein
MNLLPGRQVHLNRQRILYTQQDSLARDIMLVEDFRRGSHGLNASFQIG